MDFVYSVRPYVAGEEKQQRFMTSAAAPPVSAPPPPSGSAGLKMMTYDVRLQRPEDMQNVLGWLDGLGVSVSGSGKRKVRVFLLEGSPLLDEISTISGVADIQPYIAPKLHNDNARRLLGIEAAASPPTPILTLTGDGQIVAVADTGLDDTHPDFSGRIADVVALGRPGDHSDPHGHGTHVSGSILGSGSNSGGTLRGMAPGARLYFQSLLDPEGGLGGLPIDLGDLFEQAYQAGARVHNNSWGSATASKYTINSIEVDEFVATKRDMLVVISAGNEGDAAHRNNTGPGYVDWLSIGSPASSKNALTVGASRSDRTGMGLAGLTYSQAWPGNFPDPPIADQPVSGDPEGMAAFSSRGPCDDRRIKPDVVAPGTDIASTKSTLAPLRHFWGPYPNNDRYALMGGTSMSAPIVAGCAALVREYYEKERNCSPSAALVKATLINGTRWLRGKDSTAEHGQAPNYHQGFGCIYLPWTIPNPSEAGMRLEFADSWQDAARQFTSSGQRFRYRFDVSGGARLRVCLAWTDLPARALQNNLNLFVEHRPSGQKWIGNADLPNGLNIPDPDNNVEVVRLDAPQPGEYMIQITSSNLLSNRQDFALVVTGQFTTGLAII